MLSYYNILSLTSVSLISLCATPATAHDATPAVPAVRDTIVVTANGTDQSRDSTGQSITVVDRAALDVLQSATIADALRTLPSVQAVTRGPVGSQTSLFIRGANSSQTLVLIDGVRINDPSSPNGAFDFGALLTGNIGRVELLRGANSIIWGSQAIGGVVAVQSLVPTEAYSVRAQADYGSHDTVSGAANIAGTSGRFAGSVGAAYYRSDGISALAGGTERDGYDNLALNGRLMVTVAPTVSIDLRSYYNRGVIAYDSPFGAGANALPVSRNRQFVGYIGANVATADGRFRNRLAYARTDINRIGTDPVVFSFNNFAVSGTIDRFEYHGAFDLSDQVMLVFGLEHEATHASTAFEGAAPDIARSLVTSGFIQSVVRPLPGLTLTAGVRHDDYSTYGGQTTFGGDIAWTPNNGRTTVRATYSEGFRAPSLTEGQPPYGNTALRPETARNFDLGIEQVLLGERISLFATYFNRRSTDLIAFSFATFQSENIDRVKTDGLEAGVIVRPDNRLTVQGNYSLTNAINWSAGTNFGNRLALRAQHSANMSVDWQSPWGVSIGASLRLIGDSFDNAANTIRLDGYALASIRAALPLTDRVDIYGRVENLFDTQYQSVAGYSSYGRTGTIGARLRF